MQLSKNEEKLVQTYIENKDILKILELADKHLELNQLNIYKEILDYCWMFAEVQERLGYYYIQFENDKKKFLKHLVIAMKMGLISSAFEIYRFLLNKENLNKKEAEFFEESIKKCLLSEESPHKLTIVNTLIDSQKDKLALDFLKKEKSIESSILESYILLYSNDEKNQNQKKGFKGLKKIEEVIDEKNKKYLFLVSCLGWCYVNEIGTEFSLIDAKKYADILIKNKDNSGYDLLIRIYLITKKSKKIKKILELLIEENKAQEYHYSYLINLCLNYADDFSGDKKNAYYWAKKYFEIFQTEGSLRPLVNLLMYHNQFKNTKEAYLILKKNLKRFPVFHSELGECYKYGWGTKRDLKKALECFSISVEYLDDANAALNLAISYSREYDLLESRDLAEKAYKKAIELGSNRAVILYADYFISKDNYKKAYEILKDFDNPENDLCWYTHMGEMYLRGIGVKKDTKKAEEYFKKSSEDKWCHCGARALGSFYYTEKKDIKKAEEYFKKGNQINEVSCNPGLAYLYFKEKSLKQNLKKVKGILETRVKTKSEQIDETDHFDAISAYNLSVLYKQGLGVRKNLKKSDELYKKAVKVIEKEGRYKILEKIIESERGDFLYPYI